MPFTIARANSIDSYEIAKLLRRSIIELCTADHDGNPASYEPWLANKTADQVEKWINGPGRVFTAHDLFKVVGVAMASPDGEVLLNYVLPDARFSGVSKGLMRAVETYFSEYGVETARLKSTQTAARFYRAIGYVETGETVTRKDMDFIRFSKAIV